MINGNLPNFSINFNNMTRHKEFASQLDALEPVEPSLAALNRCNKKLL